MLLKIFSQLITVREAFAKGDGIDPYVKATNPEGLPNPLQYNTIEELLTNVWGYLFAISIPLVAIMVIIGAFQIMFAAGNVEKVETGKKTVLYAVVGFTIILLAGGVVSLVSQLLGVDCLPQGQYGPLAPGQSWCP